MTRHSFSTAAHTIVVGWDSQLETFFAQVWEQEPSQDLLADEHDPVLWVGAKRGEVPMLWELQEHLRPYAPIPNATAEALVTDFEQRKGPTPLQRNMAGLVEERPATAETQTRTYLIRVEEVERFWETFEVEASSVEEAKELAVEQYRASFEAVYAWQNSRSEGVEAIPLRGHEQEQQGAVIELPPDPDRMNDKRAGWAEQCVAGFTRDTGADREDALSDLLADLRHWCDRNGQDFGREMGRARTHYEAEVEEITEDRHERGEPMAAWRPYAQVIEGVLDNTTPGRVTGWMRFAGLEEPVTFDLAGDFHRDIRRTTIKFENPGHAAETEATREHMKGFATHQTGKVGDITAGLQPADYVDYPYLEWYSDHNGRVVLELEPGQVQVIGTPLEWQKEEPVSREEQARNMGKFLTDVAASFSPQEEAGAPGRGEPEEPRS